MTFGRPELVPIDSIRPPAYQPRMAPVELMLNAVIPDTIGDKPPILEGAPSPIIVKLNGEIIDGAVRWKAMKLAGASMVFIMRATDK